MGCYEILGQREWNKAKSDKNYAPSFNPPVASLHGAPYVWGQDFGARKRTRG